MEYNINDKIYHKNYGNGIIEDIIKNRAIIKFDSGKWKTVNLSKLYNFCKENNIKFKQRNEELIKLLNSDITYEEIANKFGITKQRIFQIAKRNGIKRWEQGREFNKKMCNNIANDINNDVSLNTIYSKYKNLSKEYIRNVYKKQTSNNLINQFRDKRNSFIINDFMGGETAKVITKHKEKEFLDPTKINSVNMVYRINVKNGVRRYPNIKNRHLGECSWDKSIIKFIVNKRDKSKWSFNKISDKLNEMGKKTLQGKLFQSPNVAMKYYKIKREKKD